MFIKFYKKNANLIKQTERKIKEDYKNIKKKKTIVRNKVREENLFKMKYRRARGMNRI